MILITGATGFIGSNLVKELLSKGYNLRVLVRNPATVKKLFSKADIVKGDITQKETLKNALRDIDTVIHLAGIVSYSKPRQEIFKINVEGTKNLLEFCNNVEKFIFSSSVAVFGNIKGKANENYPCNPTNPYGESKYEAEKIIMNSGIDSLILRLAPVYGVGSKQWIKNLKLLESGFPIPNTKNLTHILHVSNACKAFELGLKKGKGIYIIADANPIPFLEFAETLIKLLGKKPKRIPVWLAKLIASFKGMGTYLDVLIQNRNYDISKAKRELGYKPKANFELEVKKMVEWYKSVNYP